MPRDGKRDVAKALRKASALPITFRGSSSSVSGGGLSLGLRLEKLACALTMELIPHLPTGLSVGIGQGVLWQPELLGVVAGLCHWNLPSSGFGMARSGHNVKLVKVNNRQ